MYKFLLSVIGIVLLSGCASFVKGRTQNITVDTQQVKEANCSIKNDKGQWNLKKTPMVVEISGSYKDAEVTCIKNGYKRGKKIVASSTRGWVFGNVLLGPLLPLGAGIDIRNGSAFEYPENISVAMEAYPEVIQPKKVETEAVKPEVPADKANNADSLPSNP
jgi:hypothetical protein